MIIPNHVPVLPDETVLSYIYRLALANGYNSLADFYMNYVPAEHRLSYGCGASCDGTLYCGSILDSISNDEAEAYLGLSVYPGFAPFMSACQQTYAVTQALRPMKQYGRSVCVPVRFMQGYDICPMCAAEDIRIYGFCYPHREHQMPAVKVCAKHGCFLRKAAVRNISGFGCGIPEMVQYCLPESMRGIYQETSKFMRDVMRSKISVTIKDVRKAICLCAKDRGCMFNSRSGSTLEMFPDTGTLDLFGRKLDDLDRHIRKFIWKRDETSDYGFSMMLCCTMFRNSHEFIRYLSMAKKEDMEQIMTMAGKVRQKGYEIVNVSPSGIVRFRHEACGREFYGTLHGFSIGWRCPYCQYDIPWTQMMESMFDEAADGKYVRIGPVISRNSSISVMHLSTGEKFQTTFRKFVEAGTRGADSKKLTGKEMQERIDKETEKGKFTLVSRDSATSGLTLKCNTCGHVFHVSRNLTEFRGCCPACSGRAKETEESFIRQVKELTNGEYLVTGQYKDRKTPVEITHLSCGKPSMYRPYMFKQGSRCPYCRQYRFRNTSDFAGWVSYATYGRYEVSTKTGKDKKTVVTDKKTGVTQRLTRARITQELVSISPSELLPCSRKRMGGDTLRSDEAFIRELDRYAPVSGIILSEDTDRFPSWGNSESIRKRIKRMCVKGLLVPVCYGAVSLPDIRADAWDVLRERYWCREWLHKGYEYGDSFLYKIGVLDKQPEKRCCASNINLMKNIRSSSRTLDGHTLVVKEPLAKVTDGNWQVLEALHGILYVSQYRRNRGYEEILGRYIEAHGLWKEIEEYVCKKASPYVKKRYKGSKTLYGR